MPTKAVFYSYMIFDVFQTLVFIWFALSGWLFRIIIFGTWVLPFAAPFLIGAVARNTVIEVC